MTTSAPRLWNGGQFIENAWRQAEADDGEGHVILPLAAWLALTDEERNARSNRLGVLLAPGDKLNAILPHLDQLPLIALAFPAYNDGRSHSKAALLKSRHGYKGEVRAVGDVLVDQIPLMLRNGFDTLEVTNLVAQARLEAGVHTAVDIYYQPATASSKQGAGYSWRRIPVNAA